MTTCSPRPLAGPTAMMCRSAMVVVDSVFRVEVSVRVMLASEQGCLQLCVSRVARVPGSREY